MDLAMLLRTDSSETDIDQKARYVATFDSITEELRRYYRDLRENKPRAHKSAPELQDLLRQVQERGIELRFFDISRAAQSLIDRIDAITGPEYGAKDAEYLRQDILGLCFALLRQRRHFENVRTEACRHGLQQSTGAHPDDLIYALMWNSGSKNSLDKRFAEHGFRIRSFRSRAQLEINASKARPAAIIVDGHLPDGPKLISALREHIREAPKIIYLSAKNTLEEHVEVRYAGAEHYLAKPVKKGTLLECLRQATGRGVVPTATVLIISDQPVRSAAYERALAGIGLEVSVLSEPLDVLGSLTDLKPDLLLIDLSESKFSGTALGDTLRQYDAGASLPIIYVGESYRSRPGSVNIGSEDYVEAQCSERYLVELIVSRIRCTRFLSSIISRDPLTGFLTENTFNERFDALLGLAMRTRDALSAIVMDIDGFRNINQSIGYMTGNAVLQSIAACILARLRYSDIVGCYGSSRIAMALPGADLPSAREVASDLRRQIEKLRHVAGTAVFSATVSVGVAGYRFDSMSGDMPLLAAQMVESANEALEAGRRRGGSPIEVYEPAAGG